MNESQFYHSALEGALLNGKAVKERIDARTAVLAQRERKRLRLSPRLIIALAAAAVLMLASVTYAAVALRNKAFKDQTNAVLDEHIETVVQPLDPETNEGWQPRQIILFDDVLSTKEVVSCETTSGTIYLDELSCHGRTELWARFRFEPKENVSFRVFGLAVSINGVDRKTAFWADPFNSQEGSHDGDRYYTNASFVVSHNPFLPGATFVFTGKVNDEPFTLTYTFTEETYQTLQQGVINAANEHKQIVDAIPDEGSVINYHHDNRTLLEVAVNGNLMYFTESGDGTMSTSFPPYSDYDSGMYPVIDGRISEFFYLGNVEQQYPEGTVYSTVLPYREENRPVESLISFSGIVFRYEWATGKVTVPKDEAQYEAWRRESMKLSKPYHSEDWVWHIDAQSASFGVTDLIFHNKSLFGMIGVVLQSKEPFAAQQRIESAEDAPVIKINGVPLTHLGEVDPLESIMAGLSKDRCRAGYLLVGISVADLPETFTLTVTYRGETVETTLHRSDVLRVQNAQEERDYDEVFDY